jgi:hypothetical protein
MSSAGQPNYPLLPTADRPPPTIPDEELYTLVYHDLYNKPQRDDLYKIIKRPVTRDGTDIPNDRFIMSFTDMYVKGQILDATVTEIVGEGENFSFPNYVPPVIRVKLDGTEEILDSRPHDTKLLPNFYFVKDISKRFTIKELERMKTEAEVAQQERIKTQFAENFERLKKREDEQAAAALIKEKQAMEAWKQKQERWKEEDDARKANVTTASDLSHRREQTHSRSQEAGVTTTASALSRRERSRTRSPPQGGRKSRRSKSNKNKRTRRKSAKRQYRRRK